MKTKKEKILRLSLILLLLVILLFQSAKTREIIYQKKLIENKLAKQRLQNNIIKIEYQDLIKNRTQEFKTTAILKKKKAEILAELKLYNLNLIDFNSTQSEINLNLKGDFNSIVQFIQYLELEFTNYQISEFKIKNDENKLFFFLKLKNELIKNG